MSDKSSARKNSFTANIQDLFDELRLAVLWQRPSILIAITRSAWEQEKAMIRLHSLLERLGCTVIRIRPNSEQPSIAHQISQSKQSNRNVYFIQYLDQGDGSSAKVYNALNFYRELFIENRVKLVLWLTQGESEDLPIHAPDFWAFRHRVIKFTRSRASPLHIPWHNLALWHAQSTYDPNLSERLPLLEKSLTTLPVSSASFSARVQLLYDLAYANWLKGDVGKSEQWANSGLELTKDASFPNERMRFLNAKAILHLRYAQTDAALQIYQQLVQHHKNDTLLRLNYGITLCASGKKLKGINQGSTATRKEASNSTFWNRLGYMYLSAGIFEEAIHCFKEAIRLEPNEAKCHESLIVCYYFLGWTQQAISEINRVDLMNKQPNNALTGIYIEIIRGDLQKASSLLDHVAQNKTVNNQYSLLNLNILLGAKPISKSTEN